jgi:predicted  nucleic acid-binding Zn-ribbon protein
LEQALATEREKVTRREEAIDGMKRTIDANRELLAAEQERADKWEKAARESATRIQKLYPLANERDAANERAARSKAQFAGKLARRDATIARLHDVISGLNERVERAEGLIGFDSYAVPKRARRAHQSPRSRGQGHAEGAA